MKMLKGLASRTFPTKTGLRIHGRNGHPEVRDALVRFACWIRREREFPVQVNVYLSPLERVIARDGDKCTGLIWIPDDPSRYPYIRIATGDYDERKREDGRDDALASDICTLCHELIHYWQWLEHNDMWEKGVARQASRLVDRYAKTTDHP